MWCGFCVVFLLFLMGDVDLVVWWGIWMLLVIEFILWVKFLVMFKGRLGEYLKWER